MGFVGGVGVVVLGGGEYSGDELTESKVIE